MKFPHLPLLITTLCAIVSSSNAGTPYIKLDELVALREETQEMFFHGFDKYMDFAYPWDELKPLTCEPRRWDKRERGGTDDILGGFSLTLVDSLDSLAVMGEVDRFWTSVKLVGEEVTFDRDVQVSVFEVVIRVLGGLLSAHLLAVGPMAEAAKERNYQFYDREDFDRENPIEYRYNGELLALAEDLGNRLLPAFKSPTHMPYYSVNLKHGLMPGTTTNAISSDIGTMLLEYVILSRLSGNEEFERVARRAIRALFARRTSKDLFSFSVDVEDGIWTSESAGLGPGLDSFYEYLIKAYVAFGDNEAANMFNVAFDALNKNSKYGPWYLDVNVWAGRDKPPRSYTISSLSAFFAGVLVTVGDLRGATAMHSQYVQLWMNYQSLPENFDLQNEYIRLTEKRNPLRPELIEATYYLYAATHDPFYLKTGRRMLHALQDVQRVDCGFAGQADVEQRMDLEDRMDTYFFAETLKYYYMLFDLGVQDAVNGVAKYQDEVCASTSPEDLQNALKPDNWLSWNKLDNIFFSTEGHIFFNDVPELRNAKPMAEFLRVGNKEEFFMNSDMADMRGVCLPSVTKKKW